jgi:hypothetical protein
MGPGDCTYYKNLLWSYLIPGGDLLVFDTACHIKLFHTRVLVSTFFTVVIDSGLQKATV